MFIEAVKTVMFWEAAAVVGTVVNAAIFYVVVKAAKIFNKIMEY